MSASSLRGRQLAGCVLSHALLAQLARSVRSDMSMQRFISGSLPASLVEAFDELILCDDDFECFVVFSLACFDDFIEDFPLLIDEGACAALAAPAGGFVASAVALLCPCASADAATSTPPAPRRTQVGIRRFMTVGSFLPRRPPWWSSFFLELGLRHARAAPSSHGVVQWRCYASATGVGITGGSRTGTGFVCGCGSWMPGGGISGPGGTGGGEGPGSVPGTSGV